MNVRTLAAWSAVLALGAGAASAETAKKKTIAWGTKSEEARAALTEVMKRVESFQFGPKNAELVKKAQAADPQWALAAYYASVFGPPPPDDKPLLEKAKEMAQKAPEGEKRYIDAVYLIRTQKQAEGVAALEALAKDYPDERLIQMILAQSLPGTGKVEESRAALERAIAIDPATPRAHALIGNYWLLKNDYAKARAAFEAALPRMPADAAPFVVRYGIAYSHLYEAHPDEALKSLETFLTEYHKNPLPTLPEVFIWNSMARINLENGKLEQALANYEKGFESVPGSTIEEKQKKIWLGRLHHGKSRTLARMGKHEEAWKEAEIVKKMIDEGGEDGKQFLPAWHYAAGYLKLEAKDYPAAIEHLKQANGQDVFHKLLLARAYEKAGDKASAKKTYAEIVSDTNINLERALAYPEAKKKAAEL